MIRLDDVFTFLEGVAAFGSFASPMKARFPDAPPVPVRIDFSRLNTLHAKAFAKHIAIDLSSWDGRFDGVVTVGSHLELVVTALMKGRRKSRPLITITNEASDRYSINGPTGENQRCIVIAATTDDLVRYEQFATALRIHGWRIVHATAIFGWKRRYADERGLPYIRIVETYDETAGKAAECRGMDREKYHMVCDYPSLVHDFLAEHAEAAPWFPELENAA
ncbi:MAG: hypothetical protein V1778_05065 [bacterium]